MSTFESAQKRVVVGTRIKPETHWLLENISKHTGLRKSTLVRAAITQWLQNAPESLPLDLRVEITRANMQHVIDVIKNLRWTYHQARQATFRMTEMEKQQWLPPHTAEAITQLETKIMQMHEQLDSWLKQQYINQRTGEQQQ